MIKFNSIFPNKFIGEPTPYLYIVMLKTGGAYKQCLKLRKANLRRFVKFVNALFL